MRITALVLASLVVGAGLANAQDSCVVRGHIFGHDGKPLPRARTFPIQPLPRSVSTDRHGHFVMRLPCEGARVLVVSGVHHEELRLPVILAPGDTIEFEVRLRAQQWIERFDSVRVIGEFNGFGAETAIPMTPRLDGTFVVSVPCDAESLRYQLLGVARDCLPTAGTLADTFFFRSGRSMSIVHAGKKPVDVLFDPRRLPRSRREARVRFADPRVRTALIHPLYRQNEQESDRFDAAYRAHLATGGDRDSFRWDWSAYSRTLRRQIARERDSLRLQYLLLSYVRRPMVEDTVLARRALAEVPPDSPLWSILPGGPSSTLWNVARLTHDPASIRAYAEKGSEAHPDRETRAWFLHMAMSLAQDAGDVDAMGRYFTRLNDEFADASSAALARTQFAPNRAIRVGQPAPEFAFTALEDSTRLIRVSDFRGQYVLLDFWAVWCGPCRAEMPALHEAWGEFGGRGLAMLSVSFDETREDVARYRSGKWAMPWQHAFAAKGFGSPEGAAFEVLAIPKPVLIGPDGVIVAVEGELRDKLRETLARLLGNPRGPARKD